MATGTKKFRKRRQSNGPFKRSKNRFIGKPGGKIGQRVQHVGPEYFGIVSVDCAKRRSKWMLTDFYGRVIVEPTTVEHTSGSLKATKDDVRAICNELFNKSVAIPIAQHYPSANAINNAGVDTIAKHLKQDKVRFQ